jgi:nucleotide-binding universal stress UspA family protein
LRSDNRVEAVNKIAQEFDSGVTTFTHVVHGKPDGQLLKVAKKHNAQLIILGKRKLSGIKKMTSK